MNYRYRVTGTWGEVPQQVRDIEDKSDAYLVYPEYRGPVSTQDFVDSDRGLVGGWVMRYAGQSSTATVEVVTP